MTTVHQDYPGHARSRRSHSPHLAPIQDHHPHSQSQSASADAWNEAFTRLQQQVSYNTRAIEEHSSHLADFHERMHRVGSDIQALWGHMEACRDKIEARLDAGPKRTDPGDIDFLTTQYQAVAQKANEVEGLKVQLDLMTRRLRRLEDDSLPAAASKASVDSSYHHQQQPPSHHYPQQAPQAPQAPQATPLHEARSLTHPTATDNRHPPPASVQQHAEVRPIVEYAPASDGRSLPGFRALDTSTGVTSWRSASGHTTTQPVPVPQENPAAPHPEPSHGPGWATVNASTTNIKRPASIDANAPHDGSAPTSPKRQKLATLMPRSSIGEHPAGQHPPTAQHPDAVAFQPQRTASGDSQAAQFSAASTASNGMRFVPFSNDLQAAHVHESWRPEDSGRGRGRGGRGSRGRGRKSMSQGDREDVEMKYEHDRQEWAATQVGPDGYYRHPQHAYAVSPQEASRARELQPAGHTPEGHYYSQQGHETPSPGFQDTGKKSRTKPTRNANGVLIRKDGRPDMRSISSAQNLRKVHAKKEAERNGDAMSCGGGGGDPTSATSSAQTGQSDDKSSVADGSASESPTTPTAGCDRKGSVERGGREHVPRSFAYVNRDDARREGSAVPETQLDGRSDRSVSRGRYGRQDRGRSQESARDGHEQQERRDTQMTDSVMMDATEAQMRERQEKAVDIPQRVEAPAVTA